jgi:hypothetical protein
MGQVVAESRIPQAKIKLLSKPSGRLCDKLGGDERR